MNKTEAAQAVRFMEALREEIKASLTDEDDEVIRDTIEGETDVDTILNLLVTDIVEQEADARGKRLLAQSYAQVAQRHEAAADRCRDLVLRCMRAAGIENWKGPAGALKLKAGSLSCDVFEPSLLPMEFMDWHPAKGKIKAWLTARRNELRNLDDGELLPLAIVAAPWMDAGSAANHGKEALIDMILAKELPGARLMRGDQTIAMSPSLRSAKE